MSILVDVNRVVSDMVAQDENLGESLSRNDNILEKLKKAAQDGDIERLYELIRADENILGHFDKMPFCETPLHIAAENGQTHFAIEVMTLKPSLALKLNVSGFSPMHLALQNNHIRMVRGFVAIDSSLVRIKGRGRITPLHHVAKIGDAELLSEFLFACPSSVNDLTIKCETVVHIAVKNHQFMAFKVLLGWVKRVNREEILDWKDEDGNTVFHIAASINQTEVMKLLRKTVKVTAKNLDGKTAMDILQTHQSPCLPEPRSLLHIAKEKLVCRSTTTLAGYLSKDLSFIEKQNTLLGLSKFSMSIDSSRSTSNHYKSNLVVAILMVTATYTAGVCPPGGFWQETKDDHFAGQMTMDFNNAFIFISLTGFAFLLSLYVILILIIGLPMWKLIYGSTAALGIAISSSYATIFPNPESSTEIYSVIVFFFAFPLIILSMLLTIFVAFFVDKRRRQQVDFPARCFSSSL
ncbi:Ankyrin repeat-containing domain superfamily [Arabidopsis thaliana x Arabidopsis arenosa]|uniref:Ankyrin repeat-containing domain superfamily n=1 Tax=Arabidopsis thaliana x Arabidopsis arenosa TaxID=1240361 RepID=A0A8T2BNW4_9BRAS|nr:Ankyrin repeat-containing domain superfamily [Arabidopsis thaliana x Arabidopsis arenosa]